MKDRCLVAVLATDKTLITKVSKKLSSSKPVDIYYCIDLKDFLTKTVESPPDIVAVSMNYQHKNIIKFPKLFKMALNAPVIVFTEKSDVHYQRLLNSAQSEYKISGTLNPHNFWFKINSILNHQENDNSTGSQDYMADRYQDSGEQKQKNSVFLKGNKAKKASGGDNSAMLSQLFAALNDDSGSEGSSSSLTSSENSSDEPNSQFNLSNDFSNNKNHDREGLIFNQESSGFNSASFQGQSDVDQSSVSNTNKEQKHKTMASVEESKDHEFFGQVSGTPNGDMSSKIDQQDEPNIYGLEKQDAHHDGLFQGSTEREPTLENEKNDNPLIPDLKNSDLQDEERVEKESDGNSSFGKIKLDTEAKDKNKKLKKDKKKREEQKKKNALEQSCEEALRELFFSKPLLEPREFESQFVHLYIIEMEDYKGFLMLNNSFNQNVDAHVLSEFRSLVIENLKKKGLSSHLSNDFLITTQLDAYTQVVKEFSEFVIHHEEDTGKQHVVSFVRREVVQPKISDSDKEGMYWIDLKVIPPHTLVNFDAFIFLPKNNRFVRYLKSGRSLSLEQAKRRSLESETTHLYLPKADKQKFIQFFIQNTINWELALYQTTSENKKTA